MKDVSMYARGICNYASSERNGKYVVILNFKGKEKMIKGAELHTTDNRMLITGLIEGVKTLKESCNITAYIQCKIGTDKVLNGKKCRNKDLIEILFNEINKRNHKIEFIVSAERQKELAALK